MRYRTSTNAGEDSAGFTWGLEGDYLFVLLGGIMTGFMLLLSVRKTYLAPWSVCCAVGAIPPILAGIYVYGFKNKKRKSYFDDCLEWVGRCGFLGRMHFPLNKEYRRPPCRVLGACDEALAESLRVARARAGQRRITERVRV